MFSPLKIFLCLALLALAGCATSISPPRGVRPQKASMETTAYCNCQQCCGWEYSGLLGLGPPVYSSGPSKGQPKVIGKTASGKQARRGTLAADPSVPFGTVVHIPGYGYGRVDDRGGAIKGNKLDLWFPSHQAAREWGRKTLTVTVWPVSK